MRPGSREVAARGMQQQHMRWAAGDRSWTSARRGGAQPKKEAAENSWEEKGWGAAEDGKKYGKRRGGGSATSEASPLTM